LFDTIAGPTGELSPFYGLLMMSPEIATTVRPLGAQLRRSVTPQLFDIIALAVAGSCACDYEMAFHLAALRDAGLNDATLEAIAAGTAPDALPREQKVAATYAQQLARGHTVQRELFDEALSVFGPQKLVEISALIGYIGMVSQLANAFELG